MINFNKISRKDFSKRIIKTPIAWTCTLCLLLPAAHLQAQYPEFKAQVSNPQIVFGVTSSSGIESLNDHYYIVGDDSPYMVELDSLLQPTRTLEIYATKKAKDGRLPGKIKPDFESMAVAPWGKDDDLLIFGSGSDQKKREIMVRVDFDGDKADIKTYSLSKFYKLLANKTTEKGKLNIEGAAVWKKKLILLNRADNTLFIIDLGDFKDYVKGKDKHKPDMEVIPYELPVVNGITARFSGACLLKDEHMLVFTASLENTPNWAMDGEILGSYVGLIDLRQPENRVPVCEQIMENGKPYLNKVESLVIHHKDENKIEMYGVTDNDDGSSYRVDLVFRTIRTKE